MRIAGWEDYPLADGAGLMAEKAFWVAYLESAMGLEDMELVEEAFGIGADDSADCYERLCDPRQWPVFRIPLRSGATLDVIHRNLEDDPGIEFVLTTAQRPAPWTLATVEAGFSGPGLSWRELIGAAETGNGDAEPENAVLSRAERLLLLLPATGDADLPGDAVSTVATALGELGAGAGTDELARVLLGERPELWEPARWTRGQDGAVRCDGPHSRRGTGPAAFSGSDALALTRALAIG